MRAVTPPPPPDLLTVQQRREAGHALRTRLPRGAHGVWSAPADRRDPIDLLLAADAGRIPALLPLRYGRMKASPFAFFRGTAALMAADLGASPHSGIVVQACGDCHLMNFGAYASPEGAAVFDINDFDETLPAPFEWDLKRLATSFVLAGRLRGMGDKPQRALVRRAAHAYRRHMHELSQAPPLDAWRARIDLDAAVADIPDRALRRAERLHLEQAVAASRDPFRKLVSGDGLRLPEAPPAVFRLGAHEEVAHTAFAAYVATLAEERRVLVERYRLRDVAFKAVGVGSVGTFCAIGLFATADRDTLLLQLKQAGRSVLAPYAGDSAYAQQGQRVVVGQRMLQAATDVFLGWAEDAGGRQFYVRQLKDSRLARVGLRIEEAALPFYARLCGRTLARAHARAGDAARIAGYLGEGDAFDEALAGFALAYAVQTEADHAAFCAAIRAGRIEAIEEKT
jgi:uncharacterized protein (DUF2252 family)